MGNFKLEIPIFYLHQAPTFLIYTDVIKVCLQAGDGWIDTPESWGVTLSQLWTLKTQKPIRCFETVLQLHRVIERKLNRNLSE